MALDVNHVIVKASKLFPGEVITKIKGAKFCMNDIYTLTRDDVDQEFKEFRFGIRKSLWVFFRSLRKEDVAEEREDTPFPVGVGQPVRQIRKVCERSTPPKRTTVTIVTSTENGIPPLQNDDHAGSESDFSYTPSAEEMARLATGSAQQDDDSESDGHDGEVAEEIELSSGQNTSNLSDGGETSGYYSLTPVWKSGRKRKINELDPEFVSDMGEQEFENEHVADNDKEADLIKRLGLDDLYKRPPTNPELLPKTYPKDIPSKFPFAPSVIKFLNTCSEIHRQKFDTDYYHIARLIFHTAGIYASEDLTLLDYKTICVNLCKEYPNLLFDGSCERIYLSMRKRFSTLRTDVRQAVKYAVAHSSEGQKLPKPEIVKPEYYPSAVPFPFPISPMLKKILLCGMKVHKRGDKFQAWCHNTIVRDVAWTLNRFVPRGISLEARRAISESVCVHYPALLEPLTRKEPWAKFDCCLRKCIASLRRGQRQTRIYEDA